MLKKGIGLKEQSKKRVIFLVDIQSFYASVEIASNPNLKGKPVVVCGDPKKRHGITLAASPEAKRAGVTTAMPAWQVRNICPNAEFVLPHMQKYIEASVQITEILEQFTDQVEVFSIDEQFLDVTSSIALFGDPWTLAKMAQKRIWDEVGVKAKVGIGENKIQAKMACDRFAKKNSDGIFELTGETFRDKTGQLPIDQLFGIGSRMKRNMEKIGIYRIMDLAERPLAEIVKKWGVMGNVLWLSANGIDNSPVERQSVVEQKGVGHSITLPRDYDSKEEIKVIILELTEEVCRRTRAFNKQGKTVTLTIRGADLNQPTGFHRQTTLVFASNDTISIYRQLVKLLDEFWDGNPVRSIGVGLTQLEDLEQVQLNFFDDPIRKIQLGKVMDQIKERYGKTSVFRASSLLPSSMLFDRATKIGGHEA